MEKLQIFKNEEFGEIRTAVINNEPYFCLKDVCDVLEIKNISDCKKRLNPKGVGITEILTKGGKQQANFINESNLYKVIFQSRKESAERFTDWVTSEVLPSIRKNGGYIAGQEVLSDDELMAKALLVAQNKIVERDNRIASLETEVKVKEQIIGELKPRADYTDKILKNAGLVTMTQIAKDYGMTGQAMNKLLHELGVQYKQSGQWLLYSKYQGMGYTHSETVDITRSDGRPDVKMNTKWTQKGRLFLYNLLKENGIVPVIEQNDVA
ncbi:MAG: phage antirepressor KilAC domain-containing protein [Clostridiales bacterium]|nr:phage antirepressor KilAC domain-containing protein [Clostridiales bacterium]